MQTELIEKTKQFMDFQNSFSHFFEECEQGFRNEFLINMYCRICNPGQTVIAYKSNVKEVYFIKQGVVEVYNHYNDYIDGGIVSDGEAEPRKPNKRNIGTMKPILYLPKFSYFGDYQILFNLKSNLEFKTFSPDSLDNKAIKSQLNTLPYIIFMCVKDETFQDLCSLFPLTAKNLKQKALERRKRLIDQKNRVSKRFSEKVQMYQRGELRELKDGLQDFHSDESASETENKNEDMKDYLMKLNERMDELVGFVKQAETLIQRSGQDPEIKEMVQRMESQGVIPDSVP